MRHTNPLAGADVLMLDAGGFTAAYVAAGLRALDAVVTSVPPVQAMDSLFEAAAEPPDIAVIDAGAGSPFVLLAAEAFAGAGVPFLLIVTPGTEVPALLRDRPQLHHPFAAYQVTECAAELLAARRKSPVRKVTMSPAPAGWSLLEVAGVEAKPLAAASVDKGRVDHQPFP